MILVTGGTGLIGSHLLLDLTKNNERVRAIKRENSNLDFVKHLFCYYDQQNGARLFDTIEWVDADILDVPTLEDAFEGVDDVYHCAAIVTYKKKETASLYRTNIDGSANVVNLCLDKGIRKLCYVSSTAAVGGSKVKKSFSESDTWESGPDQSDYSISKFAAEREVWRGIEEGLNAVIVNPGIILGPGNWNQSSTVIFRMVHRGLRYFSSGANAFVDVRDVSQLMQRLMKSDISKKRFLIIAENISFKKCLSYIAKALDKKEADKAITEKHGKLLYRVGAILHFFFRIEPKFTKENVQSAFKVQLFQNDKIVEAFDYQFIPIQQSINDAAPFFKTILNRS